MPLTSQQLQTLKTYIDATPELAAWPNNSDGNIEIAEALNTTAAPAFTVWRTAVPVDEIMQNGFVWTEVDALTNSKARIWEWMRQMGFINPSKANVRQGLRDCFGVNSGTYTGMLPHLKRAATVAEKLLATGQGTDANPGTMAFEGSVSHYDVEAARTL